MPPLCSSPDRRHHPFLLRNGSEPGALTLQATTWSRTRTSGVGEVGDGASVLRPAPRSRAVCRQRTRSCPPPGAWAATALRGAGVGEDAWAAGAGRGRPRPGPAQPAPRSPGDSGPRSARARRRGHPLPRIAEPAPRHRLLDLRPGQPVGLLPQERRTGCRREGCGRGRPGGAAATTC